MGTGLAGMKKRLAAICARHLLPDATVREAYIPFIPPRWNGVLVLAEAQNHGMKSAEYLAWLRGLSPAERVNRLYRSHKEIGIRPWDDGSLKLAVEAALGKNAEETAVSNACLWSQVRTSGKNLNPSKAVERHSSLVWKGIFEVLAPRQVVTAGNVAKRVVEKAGVKPLAWRLPAPNLSRMAGLFEESDLLRRYPEVVRVMKARPQWFESGYRRNKVFFMCHAVSVSRRAGNLLKSSFTSSPASCISK